MGPGFESQPGHNLKDAKIKHQKNTKKTCKLFLQVFLFIVFAIMFQMAGYYKFELTDPFDCSRSIAIEVSNIFTLHFWV